MYGDLYSPTEEMNSSAWHNFDLAIMSMALHHVKDPVEMLRRLKQRLRPGGTLVIAEFLGKKEVSEKQRQYDPNEMVEVVGKQRIWSGFTTGNLEADLTTVGLEGFDVRILEEPSHVPWSARREHFGGEQWCFFAKAVAPAETA